MYSLHLPPFCFDSPNVDFRSDLRLNLSVFVPVFGLPVEWMLLCFCGLDRWMDNWDECIIDFIRKFAG